MEGGGWCSVLTLYCKMYVSFAIQLPVYPVVHAGTVVPVLNIWVLRFTTSAVVLNTDISPMELFVLFYYTRDTLG
jgi:hypothetical protein